MARAHLRCRMEAPGLRLPRAAAQRGAPPPRCSAAAAGAAVLRQQQLHEGTRAQRHKCAGAAVTSRCFRDYDGRGSAQHSRAATRHGAQRHRSSTVAAAARVIWQ
eukprot:TRINITY_DN5299_c0_g1_i1.p2 TRINITY_DN5299_c0_g1~~TRINITY_DN5299_c0_g1_i1.p2  ORF type:complete len:105 (-),score=30.49 TRINITY_DN5299_c0_g1_i1:702-1016(-)